MDYGIDEELIAVEAIFGPDVVVKTGGEYVLHVPNTAGVQLSLSFPPNYPDSCVDVDRIVSAGSSTTHGRGQYVLETVRATINSLWAPGEAILHPLIEELQETTFQENTAEPDSPFDEGGATKSAANDIYASIHATRVQSSPKEWFVSEVASEKKSTFVAHATSAANPVEAKAFIESLIASDKKFEKATHNISAYRGHFTPAGSDRELVFQDCDDDGEDAAGGRLLHLLELTGSWNVVVVVSRWYGGIKLGPDRFRIINQVARDAIIKGGYFRENGKKTGKKTQS